ncbi:MAG: bifunctional nuclease domain-containing protein [Bacteroidota bacterium]
MKIQVDILGLSTSPASGGAYALILKEINGNRRLPIIIGAFEAQSIALEMEGIKPPRPLTHDLMKNIIDTLGVSVAEVIISELRDGTFFAKLNLEGSGAKQEVDSRPSDAIALGVRFGVPIFVSEKVMEEASFLPENEEALPNKLTPGSEKTAAPKLSKLDLLRNQLKEAVEREEYEIAAKLRDEIKKLERGS